MPAKARREHGTTWPVCVHTEPPERWRDSDHPRTAHQLHRAADPSRALRLARAVAGPGRFRTGRLHPTIPPIACLSVSLTPCGALSRRRGSLGRFPRASACSARWSSCACRRKSSTQRSVTFASILVFPGFLKFCRRIGANVKIVTDGFDQRHQRDDLALPLDHRVRPLHGRDLAHPPRRAPSTLCAPTLRLDGWGPWYTALFALITQKWCADRVNCRARPLGHQGCAAASPGRAGLPAVTAPRRGSRPFQAA
jgi:hypothetical protein